MYVHLFIPTRDEAECWSWMLNDNNDRTQTHPRLSNTLHKTTDLISREHAQYRSVTRSCQNSRNTCFCRRRFILALQGRCSNVILANYCTLDLVSKACSVSPLLEKHQLCHGPKLDGLDGPASGRVYRRTSSVIRKQRYVTRKMLLLLCVWRPFITTHGNKGVQLCNERRWASDKA